MTFTLALLIIFLLAGFIQGITGFGSAMLAIPLLVFFIDIKIAVPLTMLNSLVITLYLFFRLKRHVCQARVMPLCVPAVPGIIIGVVLLKIIPSQVIAIALGIMIILYSLYSLFAKPAPINPHKYWSYFAGFSTGLIGALFSAGGPPTIIFVTLTNWSKDEMKAILTSFFLFNASLILLVYAVSGVITTEVIRLFLISAPPVLLGAVLGSVFYNRMSRDHFLKSVFLLLILMGTMMIITA